MFKLQYQAKNIFLYGRSNKADEVTYFINHFLFSQKLYSYSSVPNTLYNSYIWFEIFKFVAQNITFGNQIDDDLKTSYFFFFVKSMRIDIIYNLNNEGVI